MEKLTECWEGLGNFCKELSQLQLSAIILFSAFFVFCFVRYFIIRRLGKLSEKTENDLDDRLVQFIRKFFGIVIFFTTLVCIMKVYGISISPLLAGAGIMGVALGFAAKETIADILAGIFLITDRPIRVGDRIKLENIGRYWGSWGDIVDIGLRRTRIRNTDGVIVNYPNALLANSVIANFSYEKKPIRVRVRFHVDYLADLDLTEKVTIEAIQQCDQVVENSAQVVIRSIWDDSQGHMLAGVLVEARYRIKDVRKRTYVRSAVLKSILTSLRNNNIPLSAPTVKVASGN